MRPVLVLDWQSFHVLHMLCSVSVVIPRNFIPYVVYDHSGCTSRQSFVLYIVRRRLVIPHWLCVGRGGGVK